MQANSPSAFFLSTFLHGAVVALVLLLSYLGSAPKESPKIFELVAGEGDDYMAKEAPALGVEGGVKFSAPEAPSPKPSVPEPVAPPPAAKKETIITPAPIQKAAPPPDAIRDFTKDVKRIATKRQQRLEAADRKKRDAEERKAKEAELKNKRLTKEEFDRQNKLSKTPVGTGSPKIARLDPEGIRGGVTNGSTASKRGAGGKALTRDDDADVLDLYFSLLKQRLKEALDKPPGLSDSLVAVVEVRIGSDGTLSGARISQSSGNADFDHAALEAFARVHSIGKKPDGRSEVISLKMRMKEEDED